MSEAEKGNTKQRKKASVPRRLVLAILKLLLAVFLLLVLALVGVNLYLKSNKTKEFKDLAFLNGGSVSFQSVDISLFKDFPAATISIEKLGVTDAEFDRHGTPILRVNELKLVASLKAWRSRQIELQSVDLKDGRITLFTDEHGYSNLKALLPKKKEEETLKSKYLSILTDKVKLGFANIDFGFTDAIKTTSIHATLDDLAAILHKKAKRPGRRD
ncbi:MAG: hypothetical protein IPN76_20975 [Saprospiraceae bacterium]|nr:hypothetical protein [Saprospiraceae bacterium]